MVPERSPLSIEIRDEKAMSDAMPYGMDVKFCQLERGAAESFSFSVIDGQSVAELRIEIV
jgi:hypothetical protein